MPGNPNVPPMNKPNGVFQAFYGNGASCIRLMIDKLDWNEAQQRPDKALWAMSAQSGTIFDGPGFIGNTIKNNCYRGWE